MAHMLEATEEQYAYFKAYTDLVGETPEEFVHGWIEGKMDYIKVVEKTEKREIVKGEFPNPSLANSQVSAGVSSTIKEEKIS